MNYERAPAVIARDIFSMNGRMQQEAALTGCPPEKIKNVRHCLNIYRERRKMCRLSGKEFWF